MDAAAREKQAINHRTWGWHFSARLCGQKTSQGTINHPDITDIHKILQLATAQYTFFRSLRETFTKTDHILGQKTHTHTLSKYFTEYVRNRHSHTRLAGVQTGRTSLEGSLATTVRMTGHAYYQRPCSEQLILQEYSQVEGYLSPHS